MANYKRRSGHRVRNSWSKPHKIRGAKDRLAPGVKRALQSDDDEDDSLRDARIQLEDEIALVLGRFGAMTAEALLRALPDLEDPAFARGVIGALVDRGEIVLAGTELRLP